MMTGNVYAQRFMVDDEVVSVNNNVDKKIQTQDGWGRFYKQNSESKETKQNINVEEKNTDTSDKEFVSKQKTKEKQLVVDPEDYIYKNVPQIDRPTLDGVKRGRTSVVPVVQNSKVKSEGYIYIFYSDFSVDSMMNGATTCDVKFQVLTTLDRKLSSLALRLQWKEMDTPLNFIDVNPNQMYHMNYTLLGDGCYSMDAVPNIVINRCRVKGMTQEECARRVRWIRKK